MIRYALACDAGHRFESWFGDSADFDGLAGRGLVTCPDCGSAHVAKAIMAPAVLAGSGEKVPSVPVRSSQHATPEASSGDLPENSAGGPLGAAHREMRSLVRAMRGKVLAGTQDVGSRFPAEARRMHDGDIPHRDSRGEATLDEARALLEDGVLILPVPGLPDELN